MSHRRLLAAGVLALLVGTVASSSGTADQRHAAAEDRAVLEPGATATAVTWDGGLAGNAPCPEGDSRTDTLHRQRFDHGIPQWDFNNGWYRDRSTLHGLSGRSDVNSSDSVDWMFLDWAKAPVGARTMLAFATKGNPPSNLARADVNSVSTRVSVPSRWDGRVYNVTAATDDEGGRLGTWFEHKRAAGRSQTWWLENIQLYTCAANDTLRIQGSNRYVTSARVAAQFPPNREVVYLASGIRFADALGGSAVAAKHHAPVILVQRTGLSDVARAQLDRLNPSRIVVLGGAAAVPDLILDQARRYARTGEVTRLAGPDRYATSAAIAATYPEGLSRVYVATGRDYPDALAGGAQAGREDAPIVFTRPTGIPDPVATQLDRIRPAEIVVIGGAAAVPDSQLRALARYTSAGKVSRIAGSDRYATAARIAGLYDAGLPRVFLATGRDFPDALSGAALAGKEGVPVLLTRRDQLPAVTRSRVNDLAPDAGVVLGGTAVVSSLVRDQLGAVVD